MERGERGGRAQARLSVSGSPNCGRREQKSVDGARGKVGWSGRTASTALWQWDVFFSKSMLNATKSVSALCGFFPPLRQFQEARRKRKEGELTHRR